MRALVHFMIASLLAALPQAASARDGEGWVVSWTGSAQGPYPVGNPSAQPDQKFAFPRPGDRRAGPDLSPDGAARCQLASRIDRLDQWPTYQ